MTHVAGVSVSQVPYTTTTTTGAARAVEIGAQRVSIIHDCISRGAVRVEVAFGRESSFVVLEYTTKEAVVRDFGRAGLRYISTDMVR